jgi:hypothetical protein
MPDAVELKHEDRASRRLIGPATILIVTGLALVLHLDPLRTYRLHSDDFPYVADARTLPRAIDKLFVPHNTHIVPAWRLLTCGVVATAGRLDRLQGVLAEAGFGMLLLTAALATRFVARETGRAAWGLVVFTFLTVNSLMTPAATWYSAGQVLGASIGILTMLLLLQGWRRVAGAWRLFLTIPAAWLAGGMWTVGHVAGPVGAVYLWADGRRRCRWAAAVPLLASLSAACAALYLGGRYIDATISFHGRTAAQALNLDMGVSHTLQAIIERLIFGNLGLDVRADPAQAAVLGLAIAACWAAQRRRSGSKGLDPLALFTALAALGGVLGVVRIALAGRGALDAEAPLCWAALGGLATLVLSARGRPLERAGAALVLGSSLLEWSFRGYLPFSSLRGVVPWYDAIPQLGAVLFAAGALAGGDYENAVPARSAAPLSVHGAAWIVSLALGLYILHRPHADELFLIVAYEPLKDSPMDPLPADLTLARARTIAADLARRQRADLTNLDETARVARRLGIGRDAITRAFGRVEVSELPSVYDAVPLLDLPREGPTNDPVRVRDVLEGLLRSTEHSAREEKQEKREES